MTPNEPRPHDDLLDRSENLPEPYRTVVQRLGQDDDLSIETRAALLAANLGTTVEQIYALYESALDMLR